MTTARYETREVLEAAYPRRASRGRMLTHAVRVTGPRQGDYEPLCDRVGRDSIADAGADPAGLGVAPTCSTCLRRDPRFRAE